jgi:hypothetical protein
MPLSLLSNEQRDQLLANHGRCVTGGAQDLFPVVKLYTPDAGACWVLVSLDADSDRAYGLIDAGTGFPELGEVSLSMLEGIRGPRGLAVAAEPNFQPRKTLSAYLADAQRDGSISD